MHQYLNNFVMICTKLKNESKTECGYLKQIHAKHSYKANNNGLAMCISACSQVAGNLQKY